MNNSFKKFLKKIVPPVVLKNVKGLSGALVSYYPEYIFGSGRIKGLKHVCIEVTYKCNCRCQMCPLYGVQTDGGAELIDSMKSKREMSTDEFSSLFSDLKDVGVKDIRMTGGEAFLRKDILELIKMAKGHGFKVAITSNAGTIKEETARDLVKYGLDGLTISLDGPKDLHNKIRMASVFDNLMKIVDIIGEEKKARNSSIPNIDFLCTVSALNQKDLVALVGIAKEKGVPLTIDPIIFTDESTVEETKLQVGEEEFSKKESFIMPDEIGKIRVEELIEELHKVKSLSGEIKQPVYTSIDGDEELRRFFTEKDYSIVNKCFAPWYSLNINPYGNVYPCSISISMGNVRETSIKEILNGKKYVEFRNKLKKNKLLPFCKKCCVLYSPQKYWNYLPKI